MKYREISYSALAFVVALFLLCNPALADSSLLPFTPDAVPSQPDYSEPDNWLALPDKPDQFPVDIFWVYPTILFDNEHWLMDTANAEMNTAAADTIRTQASVFTGQANLYAPLYRQMNLAALSLPADQMDKIFQYGKTDVFNAFKHYLKYYNQGRPFILAGHSQGSDFLFEMALESWGTLGVEDQLVAAYIIGWSITSDDLAKNKNLTICMDAKQTRCFINYNTMAPGRQSVAPTLQKGSVVVNPLSWTTEGSPAPANMNLGAVFFETDGTTRTIKNYTGAQIVDSGLVIQPEDMAPLEMHKGAFPKGVYHFFDYSIFYENLRHNAGQRIQSMLNEK